MDAREISLDVRLANWEVKEEGENDEMSLGVVLGWMKVSFR